ncbi:tRNA 2-thiouridine synthesizing protein B [Marinobacter gudaonensis]|uniref:tRNA 2-thiouridine synthesizing protein B n=1 Tax=Marinobacter gudaonensis TaxID=375760 RepID=A0A1I6GBW0_9GAMM|nr:sulfurtransferase complex subunit TusB [Marinobacter gudaonensis]SFR39631.1 tRNA 2-thiouridine synthesizing protein B [Marinobacter gudaonensis]
MAEYSTLHILNKAPEHPRTGHCLAALAPDDALLLIENATLLLATQSAPATCQLFASAPDIQARGLQADTEQVKTVGYSDMVSLSLAAKRVISW